MQNLTRSDTTHHQKNEEGQNWELLNKFEIQKLKIQKELELIRNRSQQIYEETKHETYFEKMERLKREYLAFHDSINFNFLPKNGQEDTLFQANIKSKFPIPTPH